MGMMCVNAEDAHLLGRRVREILDFVSFVFNVVSQGKALIR